MPTKVFGYFERDDFKRDIAINPVDINSALMEHAGLFAHYSEIAAKAQRQVDNIETNLKAAEARLYRHFMDNPKTPKKTGDYVKALVTSHSSIVAMRLALNEAKQIASTALGAARAFAQRKDMLVQISSSNKKQMDGELRMYGSKDSKESEERKSVEESVIDRYKRRKAEEGIVKIDDDDDVTIKGSLGSPGSSRHLLDLEEGADFGPETPVESESDDDLYADYD